MSIDHYTYRVTWSPEDNEHVGLCAEFPSLSWLDRKPDAALAGIRRTVARVVADLRAGGEAAPEPLADRQYSGEFRVPPASLAGLAGCRTRRKPESAGERKAGGVDVVTCPLFPLLCVPVAECPQGHGFWVPITASRTA